VSTQYLVRTAWGQELMAFEQNTGARPLMRPR
jgi:spermidine/putrescine transport system ATP-binding protein